MNNFSPNMLKTFESCPVKYYFKYIKKVSVPQKASFFEKGKKIHALAHYYLRGDNISKLETALTSDEKHIWESLKANSYFQKKYVNSEYNLSCKIGDFWVGGRLDALMKEKNGHSESDSESFDYFILDYKTGSIPKTPEKDYQTMVYLLCADKFIKNYNSLKFIYIDLKNNENYAVEFHKDIKVNYENSIKSIVERINKYTFDSDIEHSKKCEFCEYQKICI